jgi:hypothetical protein
MWNKNLQTDYQKIILNNCCIIFIQKYKNNIHKIKNYLQKNKLVIKYNDYFV